MNLQKKLDALKGDQPSSWKEKALYRKNNQDWLKRSQAIAVRILEALRAKKHEVFHTLGGLDNNYQQGGLRNSPPEPITAEEVDILINQAYENK